MTYIIGGASWASDVLRNTDATASRALDFTGWTITAQIWERIGASNYGRWDYGWHGTCRPQALLTVSTDDGGVVAVNAAQGLFQIVLTGAQTRQLANCIGPPGWLKSPIEIQCRRTDAGHSDQIVNLRDWLVPGGS